MKTLRKVGGDRVHGATPDGDPLCGARLGSNVEQLGPRVTLTCPRCIAIQTDRKRRREREEGGGGFDPFVQIKLTRNARGAAQWEIIVPFGATTREVEEAHVLAVDEYRALENEFGTINVAE